MSDKVERLDRAFVSSLSSEERAALVARSDLAGLRHLAFHLGLIVLTSGLILGDAPFLLLWVLLQGIFLIALFAPLHETIHRTAFRSLWLNLLVSYAAGFILFMVPGWFRHFHLAHHAFTQDAGRDPELLSPKPRTVGEYLRHLTGMRVWYQQFRALFRLVWGAERDSYIPVSGEGRVRLEARIFVVLYVVLFVGSIVLGSATLLWLWLIPVLLGQPFLRLYLLAEHGGCPLVLDMIRNTRTTVSNVFVRFLMWNMPYHTEHHIYPTVPFHRLPRLHRLASGHLVHCERGYASFHRHFVKELN